MCFSSHKDASSEEKVVTVSWEATSKLWLMYNFDSSLFLLRVTLILAIVMNRYTCSRRAMVRSKNTSTSHEQIAVFHYAWKLDTAHLYKIQSCITVLLRIWGSMVSANLFHVLACATRNAFRLDSHDSLCCFSCTFDAKSFFTYMCACVWVGDAELTPCCSQTSPIWSARRYLSKIIMAVLLIAMCMVMLTQPPCQAR
jgi:hypothetical protein